MSRPIRFLAQLTLLVASALTVTHASAAYPDHPVRIIVPFSAGGFTDSLARIMAQELSRKWNQPVIVENKAGGGSNIGADLAAKAPADGYTLLLTGINHTINAGLIPNLPFDPVHDFVPVVLMVSTPNLLLVNPSVQASSVSEFVALVRANPGKFNYGSSGIGSTPHMQGELFKQTFGLQMTHVPYKGSSQALTDMLAGSVQVMFDNYMFELPHAKSGKVRPIAITARKRSDALPDVPTMEELGIAGFERGPWFGFLAPAKTPPSIVRQVNADVNAILLQRDVQEKLTGTEIIGGSPQEFQATLDQEFAKWGRLIRDLNIKPD